MKYIKMTLSALCVTVILYCIYNGYYAITPAWVAALYAINK